MTESTPAPGRFRASPERLALVERLLRERGLEATHRRARIERGGATNDLPLSFAQERLWFLEQIVPETAVYNIPTVVRLRGPVVVEALEYALEAIVRRHATLRTVFRESRGRALATEMPAGPVAIPVVDLSPNPPEERERLALAGALEEAARPFDLAAGPPLRTRLWRLAADDHLWALVTHHIVSEGWSLALLFDELELLYEERVTGVSPRPLPDLPVTYADYARWERGLADDDGEFAEHVAHWVQKLSRLPDPLLLPTDHPRPSVPTQRGTIAKRTLPREVSARLNEVSRAEGTTLFMTLLTAYFVLLHRYTGHEEILVGSPVSMRGQIEVEKLIGFFLGTIVLGARLEGNPTFHELLQQVRATTVEAFSHQEAPFERVVSALPLSRALSHHPVFQVMFALQNTPPPALRLRGITPAAAMGPDIVHSGTTKIELAMIVEQVGDELTVWVEYAADLFAPETITRLLGHYARVVETLVGDPGTRIGDFALPTPSEDERRRGWQAGPENGRAPNDRRTVVDLVAERAREAPEAPAIVAGAVRWSYGDLMSRTTRLAHHLDGLGLGRGAVVGVYLDRGPELVQAQLAVMMAGGAYVPLDPAYPAGRLEYLIGDASMAAVITESRLAGLLPTCPANVVCVDRDLTASQGSNPAPFASRAEPDGLAYVIYTSGSTGRPKGVEIEHRGLTNLVDWHREAYAVTAADRATLLAAVGFDASVWETWPYLASGASLYVPDEETRLSPAALLEWLRDGNISLTFLPTPLFERVVQLPMPGRLALRAVLTGGDRLTRRPGRDVPFRVVNHYGPTEYTVVATAGDVSPADAAGAPPPIGRPIANTLVSVLDRYGHAAPIGVPGELVVGGASLARGYHRRPDLTAERFVRVGGDALAPRAYRTGDLVRWLPTGELDFVGRVDEQVKVQGVRIELGEVEAVLAEHPAVREAAVAAQPDGGGEGRLVGYLVFHPGESLTTSEVRRWLGLLLPKYMVPSFIMTLERLPLSPHGKVDRRALPNPFGEGQPTGPAFEPPATEPERIVAETWARLLRVDRVGRRDNFYELGGHSLLSVQVVAELAERTGVRVNPRVLFFQDVAQVASALGAGPDAARRSAVGRPGD